MRVALRFVILVLCLTPLAYGPAFARRIERGKRVLGVIVQTEQGKLDNAVAQTGADVYSCDRLETDQGGTMRVTVGPSQIFLTATSLSALEDDGGAVQALAMQGTLGFSFSAGDNFSVRTPAGIIRSMSGQAIAGQVTYEGPQKLLISSMRGELTLDTGNGFKTIPEGKSAEVTFDGVVDDSCHDEAAPWTQAKPLIQPKIGFYLLAAGGLSIPPILLWHHTSESDSKISQ